MTTALPSAPRSEQRPYQPYGVFEDALYARDAELLLAGPAGTGKSRTALEKLNLLASKYAGTRLAMVRKTRKSLTQSAQVTFEHFVLTPTSPVKWRTLEQEYRYPNGSKIVLCGLDDPVKIMSSEFDVIYVQEATEIKEADAEACITRLRWGVTPYTQLLMDCNPQSPNHWLYKRQARGQTRMLETRHQDNPFLYDHAAGTWNERGARYLANLEALTGVRRARLLEGRWVTAEGVIYEEWDRFRHLIPSFALGADWPRFITIDFGYNDPFVAQWWAKDPDGRLYLYRELVGTERLVEDWAHELHALSGKERIVAVVTDHAAEDRATLERHLSHGAGECVRAAKGSFDDVQQELGRKGTIPAYKSIRDGIQAVKSRLHDAGDGSPRLFVFEDSLVRRDERLTQKNAPIGVAEEMDSYIWDTRVNTRVGDRTLEQPLDRDNHSMDALRYAVAYADGLSGVKEQLFSTQPFIFGS